MVKGRHRVRVLRDPTLQFIISLLLAPLFAILGTSVSGTGVPWPLVGWLVTLIIWSVFAIRSAKHLWQTEPHAPFSGMRLRVGITFFAMVVVVTAVIIAVLLVITLIR